MFLAPSFIKVAVPLIVSMGGLGLMLRRMSERELARHIEIVMTGGTKTAAPRNARGVVLSFLKFVGSCVQKLSVFSKQDIAELERTARMAGLSPENTVPAVIGGKLILMISCPAVAYLLARGMAAPWPIVCTCIGVGIGMFGPNAAISYVRKSRTRALRLGLSDALDLLVVCTEAGLGLESAIDRVATEMRASSPETALEFSTLGQDLRLSSDRGAALLRMGERTGLDSFQRLTMTLAQTLRYGTPLGQALRLLAIEMRNDRLLRLEEKAARLPTLLMIPLAMFILPCLFIVVAGPAALRMMAFLS
jgi:tight adherence protein C